MIGLKPLFKGVVWGLIGFLIGKGILAVVRLAAGMDPFSFGPTVFTAYWFGFSGWLLGIGVWDKWAKGWLGLSVNEESAPGWHRYLDFTTDHKVIGIQYLVTFMVMFFMAGLLAMLMRAELMDAERSILSSSQYNQVMSLHGITMIFVAVVTVLGRFGNYIVPLMIGAEDMAYPRLNALSFWMVVHAPIQLLISPLVGGWDSGWTAYPPLNVGNDSGQVLLTWPSLPSDFRRWWGLSTSS